MRARNIKPGFVKNEELAKCPPLARILFAGLWMMCDRKGRLEDRPQRIKAEILPYDRCDIEKLLGVLDQKHFIARYEVGGVRYIALPKFDKHQHPHKNEPTSTIPAPSKNGTCTGAAPDKHPTNPEDLMIIDSLITESRKGGAADSSALYEQYHKLLEQWPEHRIGEDLGAQVWQTLVDSGEITEEIIPQIFEGLERWKVSAQWAKDGGKFIPALANAEGKGWLQMRRWKDHPKRASGEEW